MERLRVLLVDLHMPRFVLDMIEANVADQPDMTVVGVIDSVTQLAAKANATRPHLVVLGVRDTSLPEECETALRRHPSLKVLGIQADAGSALLYELAPRLQPIGSVTPREIVHAIRAAGARPLFPPRVDG